MRTLFRFFVRIAPFVVIVGCAETASNSDTSSADALTTTDKQRDPVIEAARHAAQVGEDTTGYLAMIEVSPPDDLGRRVADLNIRRRALYTGIAERDDVTVADVAQATACLLYRNRIAVGDAYRAEDGSWAIRQDETPIPLPAFCR